MKDVERKTEKVPEKEDASPEQKKPKALSQRMENANPAERLTGSTPKEKENLKKRMDSDDQIAHDVD